MFPLNGSVTRRLASLHRIPRGSVLRLRRYYQGAPTPAVLPASLPFVRQAVPRTAASREAAGSRCDRLLVGTAPVPHSSAFGSHSWRHAGSPRFLGNPFAHMPCSSTPADPAHQASKMYGILPSAPVDGVGSAVSHISRLNHTACALAVYASRPGSLRHRARLATHWRPPLVGQDSHLPGCIRRFPLCASSHIVFPSSKLFLAHQPP